MAQFTFVSLSEVSLSEDDNTYYDRVYQDFHANVAYVCFDDDGTFIVTVSDDYLERVFNRPESDGSGLCQNYALVTE